MAKKLRKVKGASENSTMHKETQKAIKSMNENIFENIAFQEGKLCTYLGAEMIKIPSACNWKTKGVSYSNIKNSYDVGIPMNNAVVQGTRVFEKMGCSIETCMEVKNENGRLTPQNGLICISDSTQRDDTTGTMIHGEDTKSTYIFLKDEGVFVIQPESAELKQKSFEEFRGDIDNLRWGGRILSLKRNDIENVDEEHVIMLDAKINEMLNGINPEFAELWKSIMDSEKVAELIKNEKTQQDSYNELSGVMGEQVTTEEAKKGKGFLEQLFGRNKEKQTQAPEK